MACLDSLAAKIDQGGEKILPGNDPVHPKRGEVLMEWSATKEMIEQITRDLVREFDPEQIILFGSQAWGEPNKDSAIDILVLVRESAEKPSARMARALHCTSSVVFPKDILVVTPEEVERHRHTPGTLFHQIFEEGKKLYKRDEWWATPEMIEQITRDLVREFDPEEVILFGSQAWGEPNLDSDIDILVLVRESSEKPLARMARALHCTSSVVFPKDILVPTLEEVERHRHTPGTLFHQIFEEGKKLYERER